MQSDKHGYLSSQPRYDHFDTSPYCYLVIFLFLSLFYTLTRGAPLCPARVRRKNLHIRWCLIFSTAAPKSPRCIRHRRRFGDLSTSIRLRIIWLLVSCFCLAKSEVPLFIIFICSDLSRGIYLSVRICQGEYTYLLGFVKGNILICWDLSCRFAGWVQRLRGGFRGCGGTRWLMMGRDLLWAQSRL